MIDEKRIADLQRSMQDTAYWENLLLITGEKDLVMVTSASAREKLYDWCVERLAMLLFRFVPTFASDLYHELQYEKYGD